jgi:hypothetical protein
MKLLGLLLLLSGWAIVFAAVALLAKEGTRMAFVLSGIGVEIIGMVLVARSHLVLQGEKE